MRVIREAGTPELTQLGTELMSLRDTKAELKRLQDRLDMQTELVAQLMDTAGTNSEVVANHRFTLIRADRVVVDEPGLSKFLGLRRYNKLTKKKIDLEKVRDAIASGDLTTEEFAEYMVVAKNKPSVRITEVTEDD